LFTSTLKEESKKPNCGRRHERQPGRARREPHQKKDQEKGKRGKTLRGAVLNQPSKRQRLGTPGLEHRREEEKNRRLGNRDFSSLNKKEATEDRGLGGEGGKLLAACCPAGGGGHESRQLIRKTGTRGERTLAGGCHPGRGPATRGKVADPKICPSSGSSAAENGGGEELENSARKIGYEKGRDHTKKEIPRGFCGREKSECQRSTRKAAAKATRKASTQWQTGFWWKSGWLKVTLHSRGVKKDGLGLDGGAADQPECQLVLVTEEEKGRGEAKRPNWSL